MTVMGTGRNRETDVLMLETSTFQKRQNFISANIGMKVYTPR